MVLGLLAALGPLSIDLYLPAFPQLREELGVSDSMVQLTLAGMTIGLALGELTVGTWSDRVGRRRPLLLATTVHVLATLACAGAPTVEVLAAFRVVQGIGAAGSAVLVLAMVRDTAEGRGLVVLVSRVTLVTTTVPLLAPVAGAALLPSVGWRGIFVVLAAVSSLVLVATAALTPETRPPTDAPLQLRERVQAVLRDPGFRRGALVLSMTYASVYAYVAASPLLLQDAYGLDPGSYALVFLINSLGLVAGVQLSAMLARRAAITHVVAGFASVAVLSAAAIVPLQAAGTGLAGLLPCLWLYVAACGGCFAGATAVALDHQGGQPGTATSLLGFSSFAAAGVVSPIAGFIGVTSATPVSAVLLGTSLVMLLGMAWTIGRQRRRAAP